MSSLNISKKDYYYLQDSFRGDIQMCRSRPIKLKLNWLLSQKRPLDLLETCSLKPSTSTKLHQCIKKKITTPDEECFGSFHLGFKISNQLMEAMDLEKLH